jgi:adenylosuccinate synthase
MSKLTLVFGGQWGSEGKGQICSAIARDEKVDYAVRVGGPNAGHTVTAVDGRVVKAQQIPVAAFTQGIVPVIGCSGLILPEVLDRELDILFDLWGPDGVPYVYVDKLAGVITEEHQQQEADLKKSIGSTGEGVGAATAERVMRRAPTISDLWDDLCDRYKHWRGTVILIDTVEMLNGLAMTDSHILIEGTQGYLLSLNTSGFYPFATSRDCGPEAIMGQIGLSFRAFDEVDVVCVMRTYPIRVGGNSGPLPNEITWEDLEMRTDGYVDTPERTTVTLKVRRIAEFDPPLALKTIRETRPTSIALTFLDYVLPGDAMKEWSSQLSSDAWAFIGDMEKSLETQIEWVSTGPGQRYTFRMDEGMPF